VEVAIYFSGALAALQWPPIPSLGIQNPFTAEEYLNPLLNKPKALGDQIALNVF